MVWNNTLNYSVIQKKDPPLKRLRALITLRDKFARRLSRMNEVAG